MADQGQPAGQSSGLAPNVASLLCYVCSFITGIVFLVIEKENKEVRFHAWQAIFFGVSIIAIQIAISILGAIFGAITAVLGAIVAILSPIVSLIFFIFWIICMVKAYQGEHYKLPFIGDLADKQAAK